MQWEYKWHVLTSIREIAVFGSHFGRASRPCFCFECFDPICHFYRLDFVDLVSSPRLSRNCVRTTVKLRFSLDLTRAGAVLVLDIILVALDRMLVPSHELGPCV